MMSCVFVCQDGRAVAGGKAVTKQQAEASILKRPEPKPAKSATVEPIQLPASFKDAFKYKVQAWCRRIAVLRFVYVLNHGLTVH